VRPCSVPGWPGEQRAAQVISFTAPATGTVGGSATLTATGGGSGNPVVFSVDRSSGSGVCTVSGTNGTTVSYLAAGSCVIDANQAGNASYSAAPQVTQTIAVDQAPAFVADSPPLTAAAGQTYDYTFAASGAPAPTYALASGAPSWLSVNASTGEVTGTPAVRHHLVQLRGHRDQPGRPGHRRAVHRHRRRYHDIHQGRHLGGTVLPGRHDRRRHRDLHAHGG